VISPVAINYRLIRTEVAPSELPLLNNIIRAEPPYYLIRFPATKRAAE
jgi:hypothetical protein